MDFDEAMRQFDNSNILESSKFEERKRNGSLILNKFMYWWDNPKSPEMTYFGAFSLSNKLFYEAERCYEYGLFEEAMITIRAAIDAAPFFAVNYKPYFNTDKFYTGSSPSGERGKNGSLKDDCKYIKRMAIKLYLLNEDELSKIYKLRDTGNFSAHLAARQEKHLVEYSTKLAEGKSWKEIASEFEREPFISEGSSKEKLEEASRYLTLIRKRYFEHYLGP